MRAAAIDAGEMRIIFAPWFWRKNRRVVRLRAVSRPKTTRPPFPLYVPYGKYARVTRRPADTILERFSYRGKWFRTTSFRVVPPPSIGHAKQSRNLRSREQRVVTTTTVRAILFRISFHSIRNARNSRNSIVHIYQPTYITRTPRLLRRYRSNRMYHDFYGQFKYR